MLLISEPILIERLLLFFVFLIETNPDFGDEQYETISSII